MDKSPNHDQLLKLELKTIRDFLSLNGFSRNLTKKLINAFTPNPERSNNIPHVDLTERATPDNLPKIWIRLPFIGKYGNILTKKFINKTRHLLKSPCKFILSWQTTNSNCFLPANTRHRMNTKAPLYMNFHALVVETPTLVKQTAVYAPVLKSIAREKTRKSMPTSTVANIFSTSNPLWNFHLTQLTL
jgi:hypothetical protein